jgi:hypothetical protein
VVSKSYSSPYSAIAATDVAITDSTGNLIPLFYRHELPENTTEVAIYGFKDGNKIGTGEGVKTDLATRSVYTSFTNTFDYRTGSYSIYFLTGSTSDGVVFNTMFNPVPAVREATWEDIDLDTGGLVTTFPLYTVEKSGRGYTFYFNKGTKWYIKPLSTGLIQPLLPKNVTADSPWFIKFTNGDVSAFINSRVNRYYIGDYATQSFVPSYPIKYEVNGDVYYVNNKCVALARGELYIRLEQGLHLEIRVTDLDGTLKHVYTTNSSLEGVAVPGTALLYESDKIASWSATDGLISMATEIFLNYNYTASHYYTAREYEYGIINLNPGTNRRMKNHFYVFYLVPNVAEGTKSIHHLVVDYAGVITECSQAATTSYPNLQLRNNDSSFNANTVIGLKYFSESDESFMDRYASGFVNTYGYLILAEVSAVDRSLIEDQFVSDVRVIGSVVKEEFFEQAVLANPRIVQSVWGYGLDGQVVPEDGVMVIDAPVTLLQDYGGVFTEEQAEAALRTHMPTHGYAVVNWVYPKSEISGTSTTATEVDLSLTYEGDYIYNIYRRGAESEAWVLLSAADEPTPEILTYTDTGLTTGLTYHYSVRVLDGTLEYPFSDSFVIKVA